METKFSPGDRVFVVDTTISQGKGHGITRIPAEDRTYVHLDGPVTVTNINIDEQGHIRYYLSHQVATVGENDLVGSVSDAMEKMQKLIAEHGLKL